MTALTYSYKKKKDWIILDLVVEKNDHVQWARYARRITIGWTTEIKILQCTYIVGKKIIGPPEFSLLDPIVNKSCNFECCGKKMHQIVANMMSS